MTRTKALAFLASLAVVLAGCSAPAVTEAEPSLMAAVEGEECETLGAIGSLGEKQAICRKHSDQALIWVALTGSELFPGQSEIDQLAVEECKIKDFRESQQRGGGSIAFPRSEERIPASGVVNVAVVPIDYPDYPGTDSPMELLQESIEKVNAWTKYFTDGRVQYNWVVIDKWLRMPKEAKYYVWDHPILSDGKYIQGERQLQSDYDQAFQVFSAAEQEIDLAEIDFAWVFSNPEALEVDWAPGYMMNDNVPTASGTYDISYYSIGSFLFGSDPFNKHNQPLWMILLHEMGHAHGLAGHSPGNEWAYDVMGNGTTLSAWNGWLVDWIPDEEFVCLDGSSPATHTVVLDSVDLNRGGTIAAVIKLSDSEVVVVESRRKGAFSDYFPEGFAAITATYIDSTRTAQRYDGNWLREKDYFSYFIRTEEADRAVNPRDRLGDENLLGYLGDTLVHQNIRITLSKSNEFDTIEVEVLAN